MNSFSIGRTTGENWYTCLPIRCLCSNTNSHDHELSKVSLIFLHMLYKCSPRHFQQLGHLIILLQRFY
jgi:hypothetical protein